MRVKELKEYLDKLPDYMKIYEQDIILRNGLRFMGRPLDIKEWEVNVRKMEDDSFEEVLFIY